MNEIFVVHSYGRKYKVTLTEEGELLVTQFGLNLHPANITGNDIVQSLARRIEELESASVPVIMHCPACHLQHVDEGEWATKPHRKHLCAGCGHKWRPSIRNTVGIEGLI